MLRHSTAFSLRQQANLVNTCVSDVIDNLNDVAVFSTKIALDEDFFLQLGGKKIVHLARKLVAWVQGKKWEDKKQC